MNQGRHSESYRFPWESEHINASDIKSCPNMPAVRPFALLRFPHAGTMMPFYAMLMPHSTTVKVTHHQLKGRERIMHTPIQSDDGDVFGEAAKCPTFSFLFVFFVSCGQIDKLRSKQLKLLLQKSPQKKESNEMSFFWPLHIYIYTYMRSCLNWFS